MDSVGAPLVHLQERCKPLLQQFVQALFDQADDALFELADKAVNNAEQNMFFESMREVRIKRRGIEQAIVRDLNENFRQLMLGAVSPEGGREPELDAASAASLSLVDHDELEEMVAVDGMVAKAEKEFAEPLALLTARIDSVLPYPLTIKGNPFGPAQLCNSFVQATQTLDLDIKAKLVLFKLFDRHVVKTLDQIYETGNTLLVEAGVLPRLKRGGASASKSPIAPGQTGHGNPREESDAEHVFSSLQQLLGQARPEPGFIMVDQRSGLVAPGLAPALPRDALMQLLGDIQQHQINWLGRQQAAVMRGVAPQQMDVLQALNRVLQQRLPNQAVSIGQVDDDAINLVSMLFQFILEDRNLAAPIKGLIARLQIPILKVAMQDRTFFGKGGHPARKLLNEFANASLGWAPTTEVERDPFYSKVEHLVGRIIDEFAGDVSVFQEALADFIAFVEMDRRRASLVEQRTIDAEDGRAKSELARSTVQKALNHKVAGRRLPAVVVKLLQDGWSNVMFLICLKEGTHSESWQRAMQTVDDLLESVSSVDSLADRARLLRTLPTLLKNLRSGLNKIGFNPFDLNQLFTELEQIHLLRLKKEETADLVPLVEPAPVPQAKVASADTGLLSAVTAAVAQPVLAAMPAAAVEAMAAIDTVPKLEASTAEPAAVGPKTLDEVLSTRHQSEPQAVNLGELDRELAAHFDEAVVEPVAAVPAPAPVAPELAAANTPVPVQPAIAPITEQRAQERVDRLQVGGWVEFQQGGGKVLRCRLAAIIRATGKYIFVNRAGVKVADNNREGLAKAYQRGELTVLDEGRLFDRALESVIGNLREMKGHPGNP